MHKCVRSLRDWGRDCVCPPGNDGICGHRFDGKYGRLPDGYDHKYVYSHFGYNLKATDMQAAIGAAQLDKMPEFARRRRANWKYLRDGLRGLSDALILSESLPHSRPCWFGFIITVKRECGRSRNEIVSCLERHGIQTRNLFSGNILRHPCFEGLKEGLDYRVSGTLEQTDTVMRDSFWVGVYPGMTEARIWQNESGAIIGQRLYEKIMNMKNEEKSMRGYWSSRVTLLVSWFKCARRNNRWRYVA